MDIDKDDDGGAKELDNLDEVMDSWQTG